MHIEIFKLKFVNVKNNFLHFGLTAYNNLVISSVRALKADSQDGSVFYFSPYPSPYGGYLDDDTVGICSSYARALGLKEDQHLVISTINNIGSIKRLHVSPWTSNDLEILCSSASVIEGQLLTQLRIVWPKQVFCAWVSSNINVNLTVDSLSPELHYGRLEEYTEIVVNVEPTKKTETPLPPEKPSYLKNQGSEPPLESICCRCIPIDESITNRFKLKKVPPFAAYLLKTHRLAHLCDSSSVFKLVKTSGESSPIEVYVQVFVVENGISRPSHWVNLFVTESVRSQLNLQLGGKVELHVVKEAEPTQAISAILISPRFTSIHNSKNQEQVLVGEVRDTLMDHALFNASVLLNNKGDLTLRSGKTVQLTLRPLNIVWSFLTNATIREISFSCNAFHTEAASSDSGLKSRSDTNIWRSLVERDDMQLVAKLAHTDGRNAHLQANVLITGRSGAGKTELSKSLLNRLSKGPLYFHKSGIDCLKLKGKRVEVIVRDLNDTIKEASGHQPSVVLLENIDSIASLPNSDHVGTEATLHVNKVAHKIAEILEECQRLNSISFVGTALSASSVHPRIYSAHGKSLFPSCVHIPEHLKEQRKDILKDLILEKAPSTNPDDLGLDHIANLTEGFLIADLVKLVKVALFEAWQRKVRESGELQIINEDLDVAISCTKPSYLEGINLLKEKKYSWSTVGGLKAAKAKITEIILWPTLHPHIMSQCPLKAPTGILIYGAPGTGKSILARAAAHESSLNFITVKGPELMSKYIGQSEESVRKVFEKAQAAKPCLLFFDEFDSLAPRRGKDQTGVTDRVVNQLLTALDGVDPLTGVFVMAATSRPDLIDPALLRPGRIGTSVHCPFPDLAARTEILSALSSTVELDGDVDFTLLAEATEGFSGADLKGLLSAAQLKVIDECISASTADIDRLEEVMPSIMERHKNVLLKQEHLLAALQDCSPSLGTTERRRYDRIYSDFLKPPSVDISTQKVTLA